MAWCAVAKLRALRFWRYVGGVALASLFLSLSSPKSLVLNICIKLEARDLASRMDYINQLHRVGKQNGVTRCKYM